MAAAAAVAIAGDVVHNVSTMCRLYHHRGCAAGEQKTGSVGLSLPVVGVSVRPRLAECRSELVFKCFAQLVHDGVDLLVGKRFLRVLEYEADGV